MIQREYRDGTAILRIEHGKANAVDLELFQELDRHLRDLRATPPKAVILTGSGKIFSAGVDLFRVLKNEDGYLERFLPQLSSTLLGLFTLPMPVVAAVNGHAIAGGCILALACDHRVLAEGKASLGVSELAVGVPFPVAPLEVLRHVLTERHARDLVMTGRLVGVEEALEIRLVDETCPQDELMDRALEAAARLAKIPARSFALTKQLLRRPTVEQIERYTSIIDPQVLHAWEDSKIQAAIQDFLDRTVKK